MHDGGIVLEACGVCLLVGHSRIVPQEIQQRDHSLGDKLRAEQHLCGHSEEQNGNNFAKITGFEEFLENYYNTDPEADKLNKLKNNLNEVKDIMVENIDKILEREQKVEILVKKTTTMNQLSSTIKKQV